MKITDVLKEDSDSSSDYQQMLAFTRANRVGGVPDEQQIPLALFKELKKQQQQNQALSSELSDAEKRINQALSAGELSKQELGMHRTELDRERAAGEKQKAAVGQLDQQYSEREQASKEQMHQLTSQLAAIKTKPGIDKKAVEELETQIKQLGEKSVPVDRLAELESSISAVQNMQRVDDTVIKDLVAKVNDAQQATQELEKTKANLKKDATAVAQTALDQVAQLKQEIDQLADSQEETDATLYDIESETIPWTIDNINQLNNKVANSEAPVPTPVPAPAPKPTPAPTAAQAASNEPKFTPKQIETGKKLGLSGDLQNPNLKFAESAFKRSIAWATGKKL